MCARANYGEEHRVRARHFDWYVRFAEESDRILRLTHCPRLTRVKHLAQLQLEHENLQQAWRWASAGPGRLAE